MTATGDASEARTPRAERRSAALRGVQWLLLARFAVAAFIIAYILISARGWGATWATKTVYAVVTGVFALNALYMFVLLKTRADLDTLKAVQIGADIAIEAVLVFLTGGVSSQIVVLFMLSVMGAALLLSWRAAVAFSAEAAALHLVVTVLGLTRLSPEPAAPLREVVSSLLVQLVAFFAVALLSGLLSHRLSVARLLSRDILEAIGQGLIVADPSDRILFSNAEARRLLGAEALASGRSLREALPAAAWSAMSFDPATGQGSLREFEVEGEGGKIPVGVIVRPALAGGERPHGTLVVLTDRTLERRFEEARSQAERSEAVSEMATAIAHELRNPLASMRGSIQEMARRIERLGGPLPSDSKSLFEIVMSESDRLDAIISDFLAFAKMRPVNKGPCDIRQVLKDSALMLRQSAAEQGCEGVEVVAECEDELHCRADAQQLRQVLLNLGLNSIHAIRSARPATRDGRIALSARPCAFLDFPLAGQEGAARSARDHARGERSGVEIEVRDNGCGMTPEVRRKVMTPFFTTKERGTGLGLAIVARIVRAHGGMIRIESEERVGTSVRVWLPAGGD